MHKEPLISVIIYVKDTSGALKKCLDTLLLQIYNNIEIICVYAENSVDKTALLQEYKQKFNILEIFNFPGVNSGRAWNEGLKQAKGDYVHFVNSDCWFMLDLYKVFAGTAAEKVPDISVINAALYKGDIIDIPCYELFDDEDLTKINDDMLYSYKDINHIMTKNLRVFNKIYKKEFLEKKNLSFLESNVYCEYLFNAQAFLNSSSVYINPEVYMRYTEQNVTEGAYTEKVFDIFDMITKTEEYLVSENLLKDYAFDFFNFICNSVDGYYRYCPNDLKRKYFDILRMFVLSRFNSMPPQIQDGYRKIKEVNFLITSDFEDYNKKKQVRS